MERNEGALLEGRVPAASCGSRGCRTPVVVTADAVHTTAHNRHARSVYYVFAVQNQHRSTGCSRPCPDTRFPPHQPQPWPRPPRTKHHPARASGGFRGHPIVSPRQPQASCIQCQPSRPPAETHHPRGTRPHQRHRCLGASRPHRTPRPPPLAHPGAGSGVLDVGDVADPVEFDPRGAAIAPQRVTCSSPSRAGPFLGQRQVPHRPRRQKPSPCSEHHPALPAPCVSEAGGRSPTGTVSRKSSSPVPGLFPHQGRSARVHAVGADAARRAAREGEAAAMAGARSFG